MTGVAIHIAGMGVISPIGCGLQETAQALRNSKTGLGPLTLFAAPPNALLPVGEVHAIQTGAALPRTHQLALQAAGQALAGSDRPRRPMPVSTLRCTRAFLP